MNRYQRIYNLPLLNFGHVLASTIEHLILKDPKLKAHCHWQWKSYIKLVKSDMMVKLNLAFENGSLLQMSS